MPTDAERRSTGDASTHALDGDLRPGGVVPIPAARSSAPIEAGQPRPDSSGDRNDLAVGQATTKAAARGLSAAVRQPGAVGRTVWVAGGVAGGLSGVGHGLVALFRRRPRGVAAGGIDAKPLPGDEPRRPAGGTSPDMDVGITGGMSLLFGGQTGPRRRGG
jgi:hypothetical protein